MSEWRARAPNRSSPFCRSMAHQTWNPVDVYQGCGPRKAHLHQRDQALTASKQTRFLSQLKE